MQSQQSEGRAGNRLAEKKRFYWKECWGPGLGYINIFTLSQNVPGIWWSNSWSHEFYKHTIDFVSQVSSLNRTIHLLIITWENYIPRLVLWTSPSCRAQWAEPHSGRSNTTAAATALIFALCRVFLRFVWIHVTSLPLYCHCWLLSPAFSLSCNRCLVFVRLHTNISLDTKPFVHVHSLWFLILAIFCYCFDLSCPRTACSLFSSSTSGLQFRFTLMFFWLTDIVIDYIKDSPCALASFVKLWWNKGDWLYFILIYLYIYFWKYSQFDTQYDFSQQNNVQTFIYLYSVLCTVKKP